MESGLFFIKTLTGVDLLDSGTSADESNNFCISKNIKAVKLNDSTNKKPIGKTQAKKMLNTLK